MPAQPKPVAKRPIPQAAVKRPVAVKPAASKDKSGVQYVHFSDKMTGALKNINTVIDENKDTLDSIQDMAVQLTRTVRLLRAVVMKYVDAVNNILEAIVPIMEKFPIFPDKMEAFAKDALELTEKISKASALAEKVLPGVEASLTTADISGLQASSGEVAQLTRALQDMIPAGTK
ncbi:MAG: hypothetical protein A2W36_01205 [Chloroflexi bacterium RBG_16_58_14]|nr:MAG: hypothetical protein A2W36_01205 [Chloroflexi bacterium RBG_16_58_14]